jgi:type IV pilus assembly protein PilW
VNAFAPKRYAGLTLVELMVSMVIGMFLMSAVASLFVSSKRSYTETERQARIGENGRFALLTLTTELRLAGFLGEAPPADIEEDDDLGDVVGDCAAPAEAYDLNNFVFVTRSDADGDAIGCIDDAVPDTDVIVIKSVRPRVLSDGDRNDHGDDDGTIDAPEALAAGRTYIMSNPIKGIIFDGADTAPSIRVGGDVPWGNAWEYRFQVYYVRNADVPRLARKVLAVVGGVMTVTTEDVADGIENLRVMVGQDTLDDGNVDSFVSSEGAIDWSRVSAVKLFLLVRSIDIDPTLNDPVSDGRTFTLGDEIIDIAGDGFRRTVMEGSLSLRNSQLAIRE